VFVVEDVEDADEEDDWLFGLTFFFKKNYNSQLNKFKNNNNQILFKRRKFVKLNKIFTPH
jgi:hypothetical protein